MPEEEEESREQPQQTPPPQPAPPKRVDLKITAVLWISLTLSSLFVLGLYDFLAEKEANKCGMSYMYELPQYVNISKTNHDKYSLYAYGEGKTSEAVFKERFSGIPVIFIPGNAGSFRQVRSLASIALRKAIEETKYKIHFDYFAVDFVEEFSALYGGTLQDQAEFVRKSIQDILSLYQGQKQAPTSVVLVGHSVGGLVAKALFLDQNFDHSTVNIIITLATPHSAPVVNADIYLSQFYEDIDNHWNYDRQSSHVSLVSIGGGVKDIQVRPGLTWSDHADINVQSTSASGIWVSADHRCIVWCKQLTLALNRVLFDLINKETGQLSQEKEEILQVFNYHLIHRTAGKRFKPNLHPKNQVFDKDGDWKDILKRQYTFKHEMPGGLTKNTYLMVKTLDDIKHEMLTVDAVNMDNDNWVFGCKATIAHNSQMLCENGINLSQDSVIIPSNGKRKTITINLDKVRSNFTHIVVSWPKAWIISASL